MLYPLKFNNIYKEKIWGGNKIHEHFIASAPTSSNIGEVWLLSGIDEEESDVRNGFLEENTLNELIEVYMGDFVGDKVFDRYDCEFPVLVKIIDANETLSVQVHPDNNIAAKRHKAHGKSELWYVLESSEEGFIYLGFKKGITKELYLKALENGTIENLLNKISVKKGDIYYIPAGTVHSIGAGVVLAEVQQTSDITYRIFDWNRKDKNGNLRQLHTDLALDAILFEPTEPKNLSVKLKKNEETSILKCNHFNISMREINEVAALHLGDRDSFTALLCLEGSCDVEYDIDGIESMHKGELVLLPMELEEINIYGNCKLLEIYM